MLSDLLSQEVGLRDIELFVRREEEKLRGRGRISKNREIVKNLMKEKLRDNIHYMLRCRKNRDRLRLQLETTWGVKSRKYRKVIKEVKKTNADLRIRLKRKYVRKVQFLVKKYGVADDVSLLSMTEDERNKYGMAEVFNMKCNLEGQTIKGPVLVCTKGEEIEISDDERALLSLGPKFCVYKKLDVKNFEAEIEEAILKFKWDIMGEDIAKGGKKKELADMALDNLLGELKQSVTSKWQ